MYWGLDTGPELEDSGWSSGELEDCPHFEELAASDNLQECGAEDILQVLEADCSLQGCWRLGRWESCCSWSELGTEVRTSCTGLTGTSRDCGLDACCRG